MTATLDYSFRKAELAGEENANKREARFIELLKERGGAQQFHEFMEVWRKAGETIDSLADTFMRLQKKGQIILTDALEIKLK